MSFFDQDVREAGAVGVVILLVATALAGCFVWWLNTPPARPTQGDSGLVAARAVNPNGVQGLGANWLLAKQANRNQDVMAEIRRLGDRNDFDGVSSVLRSRAAELNQVIAEVEADSSYSVADKRKILAVLTQERDWALSSYIGLKSIN
jgi:hypothetical protein